MDAAGTHDGIRRIVYDRPYSHLLAIEPLEMCGHV